MCNHAGTWNDARQHLLWNTEQLAHCRIPTASAQVHEQRARGVRRVAHVLAASCAPAQLPDQEAVDGSEAKLKGFGSSSRARHVLQQPVELRSGKIRVQQ